MWFVRSFFLSLFLSFFDYLTSYLVAWYVIQLVSQCAGLDDSYPILHAKRPSIQSDIY
jgi:hypothetical protein